MSVTFLIYLVILLTGSIAGLYKFGYLPPQLKGVALLLVFTFITEVISRVLIYRINNSNPVYHFFDPLECILLYWILRNISQSKANKLLLLVFFSLILIATILNSLLIQGLQIFNSNSDLFKTPLIVLVTFLIVWEKIKHPDIEKAFLEPDIIILIAILWYYLSSFVFVMAHNYLVDHHISTQPLGIINFISNVVYYLLYLLALMLYNPLKYSHEQQ